MEVKLKEVTALNKYKSIAEKIRDLSEKYAPLTGTFIGENNELIGNVEGMTPGQKALFTEYKEELAKLRGQLLELLPVWEQIFGDQTYKSYGQIQQASDYAQQIIDNASVTKIRMESQLLLLLGIWMRMVKGLMFQENILKLRS